MAGHADIPAQDEKAGISVWHTGYFSVPGRTLHLFYRGEIDHMEKITYRKMKKQDISTIVRMRVEQLRDEGAPVSFDLSPDLFDFYERNLERGLYVSWLAESRGKIVATSGMSFTEKPPYYKNPTGKIGLLSSMYTVKEFRRKGIARRLLEKVLEEAGNYGCGTVHVTASDMGMYLYKNFGFRENGNFMQFDFD